MKTIDYDGDIKLKVKETFEEHYRNLSPDYDKFIKCCGNWLRKSVRINKLKVKDVEEVKKTLEKEWILDKVPWVDNAFFIKSREGDRWDIGNTKEHYLGYVYVQEAASMIPPIALDPKEGEIVLDMAASPGSKTTQIAELMNNKGIIVANDLNYNRLAPLNLNLQRLGVRNTIVTNNNALKFDKLNQFQNYFDKVLLDAPCSGTGTIRKSPNTTIEWGRKLIAHFSREQKKLIETAFNVLKPNGVLVYSTCSLEPEEDEEVVDHLLRKFENADIEEIKVNIKKSKCILEFEGKKYDERISKCVRLWPEDNDTEGFFVAKIRKKD